MTETPFVPLPVHICVSTGGHRFHSQGDETWYVHCRRCGIEGGRDDILLNRSILNHYVCTEKDWIAFQLDDGATEIFIATGDCCSTSWIESIDTPGNLRGLVLEVHDLEMPPLDTHEKYEEVKCYGWQIVTTSGHTTIEYRNGSNGYYGGDMEWSPFHAEIYDSDVDVTASLSALLPWKYRRPDIPQSLSAVERPTMPTNGQ